MSYSISVRGTSRAAALSLLAEKFDREVIGPQPVHAHDRDQALAAAEVFVNLTQEPDDQHEIALSLSGSIGWQHDGDAEKRVFTAASVSVSSYHVTRTPV